MRVLVEMFDKDPIQNLLGACIFKPEIVVFICDKQDASFFRESTIYRLFRRMGLKTRARFLYINAGNIEEICHTLAAVTKDYPGCVFDYAGGKDLVILLAGIYGSQKKLPGYYIDLPRGKFLNIYGCEKLEHQFYLPRFTAGDLLALSGATIHGYGHFSPKELDADFEKDVFAAFSIIQKNPKAWGDFVGYLQGLCVGTPANAVKVEGPVRLVDKPGSPEINPAILHHLEQAGLIAGFAIKRGKLTLRFKSPLHRRCLLNQGIWLELFGFVTAKNTGFFDDVQTSVVIDWDGVEGGQDNAKNEVDILLVKGVTPVFISCKMGIPSPLALSEVKILSDKFGGSMSRAVVLSAANLGEETRVLQSRARELGILLLDGGIIARGELASNLIHAASETLYAPPSPLSMMPPVIAWAEQIALAKDTALAPEQEDIVPSKCVREEECFTREEGSE